MHIHTYMYVYIYMYWFTYGRTKMLMYMCMCIYMWFSLYSYVNRHIRSKIYTHIHRKKSFRNIIYLQHTVNIMSQCVVHLWYYYLHEIILQWIVCIQYYHVHTRTSNKLKIQQRKHMYVCGKANTGWPRLVGSLKL